MTVNHDVLRSNRRLPANTEVEEPSSSPLIIMGMDSSGKEVTLSM